MLNIKKYNYVKIIFKKINKQIYFAVAHKFGLLIISIIKNIKNKIKHHKNTQNAKK